MQNNMLPEAMGFGSLYREEARIETFSRWPFSEKCRCNAQKMAEAGFYACGGPRELDLVACFLCDKELDGWEETDDPWDEHRKHRQECPFVKLSRKQDDLTYREFLIGVVLPFIKKNFKKTEEKMLAAVEDIYSEMQSRRN